MKKINLSKLKFAAISLLLLAGSANQALADDWANHGFYSGSMTGVGNLYTNYNSLRNGLGTSWGAEVRDNHSSPFEWSGEHCIRHAGTSQSNTCVSIGYWGSSRTIPSYSKLVRSVTFSLSMGSNRHHHGCGLYLYDHGQDGSARNDYFDVSYQQNFNITGQAGVTNHDGSLHLLVKYNQCYTGNNHAKTSKDASLTYDNSSNTSETTLWKYVVFVHSSANGGTSISSGHEWASWIETSSTDTWYYYKRITFDSNGGTSGEMAVQTIENSGNLNGNTYIRPGYKFTGWNTKADGTGTAYTNGQAITATSEDKGPVTLYAQWEIDESNSYICIGGGSGCWSGLTGHHISYNGLVGNTSSWGTYFGDKTINHKSGDATVETYSTNIAIGIYQTARVIPSYSKLVRDVSFWISMASNRYDHGVGLYLFDDETTAKSTDLDATYEQSRTEDAGENYKIVKKVLYGQNSSGIRTYGSKKLYYDNGSASTEAVISKYVAMEHSSGCGGTRTTGQENACWNEESSTETWYYYKHITFVANEGTGDDMAVQIIENSGNLNLNTYTCEGYAFAGWNTKADGSGTTYADGQAITATLEDKGPVTLYAQWAEPQSAGKMLNDGEKWDITSNVVIVKENNKNGIVIADGATATIHIADGKTLTVYGGDGNGVTAGKAGILLPSGSTLNVTGKGTLIVYGGNAGNGTNGEKGYAVYHGVNYKDPSSGILCANFTSYPGSGGNGGGGAGAGIGTDGSNGANGQSVGNHKSWTWWNNFQSTASSHDNPCLTQATQESAEVAACGTLNISTNAHCTLNGGLAGTSGSIGEQGRCVVDSGSGYAYDLHCGAGGAGGGGGAGSAGAGYGTGGRGGQGGSCGTCGTHMRDNPSTNSSYNGTTKLQGAQGTTGGVYASGTSSAEGTIHPVTIGGKPVTDFTNVVITDGDDLVINEEETVDSISYTRTMTNAWGTICLPFALVSNKKVQYYKLAEVDDETMTFEFVESVPANTPAVFRRLNQNEDYKASARQATLSAEIQAGEGEVTNWSLTGTFKDVVLSHTDTTKYYIANNQFWCANQATADITIPAYRAYFSYEAKNQEAKPTFFNIAIAGDPTVIGRLDTETGELNIMTDGKYLENGNVIIIKNGKKYNIKGQKIK